MHTSDISHRKKHRCFFEVDTPNRMLCYYGARLVENRRWEDNIKMHLKEISVDMMSYLRIKVIGEPLLTWH